MSKDDLIKVDGRVVDATGGGNYKVTLDNGISINAKLSGKMKKFKIRVLVGDKVTVGVSPYDPTHGLITHRHKEGGPPPPDSGGA
jgi:translation initiation factor IF-1